MSWHSLPLFVRVAGRPVILLGEGAAAEAKRRILERAGAQIVGEGAAAALAIVAIDADDEAKAAVTRLKARGILVNAVDRPALCDFTLPAIVDRDPLLIAVGTGGASAGLAAAVRQRLEQILPDGLGRLADALMAARSRLRTVFPDPADRRRALAGALAVGGALDPLGPSGDGAVDRWLDDNGNGNGTSAGSRIELITLTSHDPDDLTLRQARLLASADRVTHRADVPPAILNRARADAERTASAAAPLEAPTGLWVDLAMALK